MTHSFNTLGPGRRQAIGRNRTTRTSHDVLRRGAQAIPIPLLVAAASLTLGYATSASPRSTLLVGLGIASVLWLASALRLFPLVIDLWIHMRWWQFLWLCLLLSSLVLRIRTTSSAASNPLDSAALSRVGLVAVAVLGLLALNATHKVSGGSLFAAPVIALLLIFSVGNLVSTVWSVYPAWTFYRSAEYLVDVVVIAFIVTNLRSALEYRRLFNWTWLLLGSLLVTVGIGALIAPDRAIVSSRGLFHFSVEGVFPTISRNSVGFLSALLVIVAVARLATGTVNRAFFSGLLAVSCGVLVISETRSALLPVVIAVPLMLAASRRVGWTLALVSVAAGVFFTTNFSATLSEYIHRGQTEQQFGTLSGRMDYWTFAWHLLEQRPMTGYGAFAGGRFEVAQAFDQTLSSSHGTIPEIAIGTSFWGVIPVLLCLAFVWIYIFRVVISERRSTREISIEWAMAVEALGVLTLITVRSFFTVELVWHFAISFLLVVGYVAFLQRIRREGWWEVNAVRRFGH